MVADDRPDAAVSPTSRPALGLGLLAACVAASCVVHGLGVDAVDGELEQGVGVGGRRGERLQRFQAVTGVNMGLCDTQQTFVCVR